MQHTQINLTKTKTDFLQKRTLDLQKQTENMNVGVASQKTRRKLHRNVFKRIKESKWGASCKSMWIKQPLNAYSLWRGQATALFSPAESKNNTKIKVTQQKARGDECIWEEISLMNTENRSGFWEKNLKDIIIRFKNGFLRYL